MFYNNLPIRIKFFEMEFCVLYNCVRCVSLDGSLHQCEHSHSHSHANLRFFLFECRYNSELSGLWFQQIFQWIIQKLHIHHRLCGLCAYILLLLPVQTAHLHLKLLLYACMHTKLNEQIILFSALNIANDDEWKKPQNWTNWLQFHLFINRLKGGVPQNSAKKIP